MQYAEKKIENLIEENIFRGQKIDNPKIAEAIKRDYDDGSLSNFANSFLGTAMTGGWGPPISGVYQGLRTGHPVAGLFSGKAGTLGAASNNVKGINVLDSFTGSNIAGNLGVFAPMTALQYAGGKLFGSRMDEDQYAQKLNASNIKPPGVIPNEYAIEKKENNGFSKG